MHPFRMISSSQVCRTAGISKELKCYYLLNLGLSHLNFVFQTKVCLRDNDLVGLGPTDNQWCGNCNIGPPSEMGPGPSWASGNEAENVAKPGHLCSALSCPANGCLAPSIG